MVVSRPPAGRDGSGGASKECKFSLFPFFKNSGNRKEEGGRGYRGTFFPFHCDHRGGSTAAVPRTVEWLEVVSSSLSLFLFLLLRRQYLGRGRRYHVGEKWEEGCRGSRVTDSRGGLAVVV